MKYLCILFILFLAFKIFKSKNPLGWYVISICIVSNDFNLFGLYSHFFYSLILGLRFFKENGIKSLSINKSLKVGIFIWAAGVCLVCIFDYNTTIMAKFIAFIREIVCSILIFAASLYFTNKYNEKDFRKTVILCFIIITCFAYFQLITGKDISHELSLAYFNSGNNTIEEWYNSRLIQQEYGRNRICSLVGFAFDYGFFASILGLFMLYLYKENKNISYLLLSLAGGLGGAIMSGSRSAIICTTFSLIMFQLLSNGFNVKKVVTTIIVIILGGSVLNDLSIITDTIDAITTGGENSAGSSADMRLVQLSASLYWFMQSPIVGNGFKFVENYEGYSSKIDDVMGSESVIFSILINSGIVGFLYWTFLFYIIIKNYSKSIASIYAKLGVSMFVSFLIFILLTGIQGSLLLTFPFLAYCMEKSKKNNNL